MVSFASSASIASTRCLQSLILCSEHNQLGDCLLQDLLWFKLFARTSITLPPALAIAIRLLCLLRYVCNSFCILNAGWTVIQFVNSIAYVSKSVDLVLYLWLAARAFYHLRRSHFIFEACSGQSQLVLKLKIGSPNRACPFTTTPCFNQLICL
ncbi:hypothetical protein MSAN_00944900 [Mycena sanguinolenta]|uniref:Uncharacterized protein n=1 Tax=Mycena sanguinolenta TaxID=230812 RepID=A0A8H6YUZ7_9AGAR|nr:hypothetical protein MSAN_00944900 [Mycena sanguinolenta]